MPHNPIRVIRVLLIVWLYLPTAGWGVTTAISSPLLKVLNTLQNTVVEEIPSGCCGMAGSFGYEKEHYEISLAVGEEALLPTVRAASQDTIIAAAGTSCRQQIVEGTVRQAIHPIIVMASAVAE